MSDFNKTEFSRQVFEKHSNIKFHENPSNGRRTDRQTVMTKITVALSNFVNTPKNEEDVNRILQMAYFPILPSEGAGCKTMRMREDKIHLLVNLD